MVMTRGSGTDPRLEHRDTGVTGRNGVRLFAA